MPLSEGCFGVVDKYLMAAEGGSGAALPTRCPRAVAEPLGVDVLHCDAGHSFVLVVGEDGGNGRIDDERDEEQEGEHGENGRRPEAERRVEFALGYEAVHIHPR